MRGVVLLLVLGALGCEADVDPPPPATRVVILGSSTAAGVGPSDFDNSWVERYRAALADSRPDVEVENLAFPGFTTYSIQPDGFTSPPDRPSAAAFGNVSAAVDAGASVIVVNLPSNDQAEGHTRAEQEANYDRVVQVADDAGIPVWVTTTQPRNFDDATDLAALVEMRDVITTRYAPRTIDFWTDLADPDGRVLPEYDSGDGVHLNDDAHAILADRVLAADLL